MATKFTGGCLCGKVRYEATADPIFMGNCHCRDCKNPAAALTRQRSVSQRRR